MKEKYDIALSFAGENRNYVEKVAFLLKERGIRVFYDKFEKDELWGKNLFDHLSEVYSENAKYVVMFISRYYVEKAWTNLERKSSQSKSLLEEGYILPVRFDDTKVPGLLNTVAYLDARNTDAIELVNLIVNKLGAKDDTKIQNAKIRITRKKREFTLKLSIFFLRRNRNDETVNIELDGIEMGAIYGGETKEFEVMPGNHYIKVYYDHSSSAYAQGSSVISRFRSEKIIAETFKSAKTYDYNFVIQPKISDLFGDEWEIEGNFNRVSIYKGGQRT